MTSTTVTITAVEIGGDRTVSWSRTDRTAVADPGQWSGSDDWVQAATAALATRAPITVAHPDLTYEFGPFDGGLLVEEVAAAVIAAAGARGDCEQAYQELPADLFDGDAPDDAIY